jgi:hypothetical protein
MNNQFVKVLFFGCVLLGSIATSFGQIDNPSSDRPIPNINIPPTITVEKHKMDDPRNSSEANDMDALKIVLNKQLAAQYDANLKNKGIITQEQIRKEKFKKHEKELNKSYAKIDQYLGGFSSISESITIVCRDFGFPDGDRVTVYVNDRPVVKNITLTNGYQQFTLPLILGLNVISFKALNQGTSGPNTAAFGVYDDEAQEISSNEWNLATGAKATLSIARVKKGE